jgi:hypothetical protein
MKSISILEDADIILPSDWCRPLQIVSMSGGHSDHYSFENPYSGKPENNAKWCKASDILGKYWIGKPVGEYSRAMKEFGSWEFIRGNIPTPHIHR